jgi:hypothetical protein
MSRIYVLTAFVFLNLLLSCNRHSADEEFPCDGVFFMEIKDGSGKQVCSKTIEKYQLLDNALYLSVLNDELAGKVIFKISLEPFLGSATYELGQNFKHNCELIVQGSTDEFYKCTSGTFTVGKADTKQLIADFEIIIEGFYNKKIIHAKGRVRL